jgi:hypothetical protein
VFRRSVRGYTGKPRGLLGRKIDESTRSGPAMDARDNGSVESRCYGCYVVELYNELRPHDSLGRVPPLTYMPRETKPGESSYRL